MRLTSGARPYRYKRSGWLVSNGTVELSQPCLIGTKPVGLALASYVIGREHVLPGLIIPMGRTESRRYKQFADEARAYWPDVKLWAVRSSSMDEGTARGVYETILRVSRAKLETAIKACMASYNQQGAVAFRQAKGPNDQDQRVEIAVFLQPYQPGTCGGVATVVGSSDRKRRYHISLARTADQVTSGGKTREYEFSVASQTPNGLTPLVSVLDRLHEVFRGIIQVEWVMNQTGKVIILQMEFMPMKSLEYASGEQENLEQIVEVAVDSIADILQIELGYISSSLHLVIGSGIDSKSFHGELFTGVVRLGRRIRKISLAKPISPSSHFANICRHFGIELV